MDATGMVLLYRFVQLEDVVEQVMKERGFSHLDGDAAIEAACAGVTDWEQRNAAEQRAIEAEAIVRRRKATSKESFAAAVIKQVFFSPAYSGGGGSDALLDGIDPDARVVEVPGLSSLGLRLSFSSPPQPQDLGGTYVASADHNIVVLYAGRYRPGSLSHGFYLVYDAWGNSFAAIPPLPLSWPTLGAGSMGSGVAVLRHALPSDYVLAELLADHHHDSVKASIWTWWSSGPCARRWVHKSVTLPPEARTPFFHPDTTTFSFGTDVLCWVDLLIGILTCHMLFPEPVFDFIPLPEVCSVKHPYPQHGGLRPVPEEYRSMCCGNDGVIRFVTIDGYQQGGGGQHNEEDLILSTWSLMPNLKEWKQDSVFRIGDLIWPCGLTKLIPSFMPAWPIHSIVEADVVYLYLADFKFTATRSTEQHMISINVQRREVLSTFKLPSAECRPPPRFFPSNFSCYFNKKTQWNQLLREKCENELIEKWEKDVTGELASFGWS